MRTLFTFQRLTTAFALSLICGITTVQAIEQDQPFLMESWTLAPGSVLEMLAVSDASDRQIAWSLTKADGTFVQADRGPLFRERFVETGDFLLRGEISLADNSTVSQRTFAIHIIPGTPSLTTGTGGNAFVTMDPPFDANGIAVIEENLQTILVSATTGTVPPCIDMNSGRDSDGDGDPANDNDSRGTFFEVDGSALRLWFTDGITERTLTVRGNSTAGPQTQTIRLFAGSAPVSSASTEQNQMESLSGLENVIIENHGSGTYAFSVDSATLPMENRAILLYWDFGDGRQSMLDRPVHTYAQNGQYTVNLQVRDLNTTQEILRVTGILPVNTILPPTQPSSAQSGSDASSSETTSETTPSRFNLRSILTIVGGLLLAILAGFAVVTMIGKIVQRHLDHEPPKTTGSKPSKKSPSPAGLPSLDQPPPLSLTNDAAPPMSVIDVTPTTDTKEMQETSSGESDTAQDATEAESSKLNELTFKEEEAPSWLKQGHEEAEKLGHTVLTALPESDEPKKESEIPAPSAEKKDRPLPPWLEPEAPAIVETTPPPAPVPPPVAIPEPEPAPIAEPVAVPPPPEPAPAPTPAPIEPPPPATPPTPPVVSPAPVTPTVTSQPSVPEQQSTPPPSTPKSSATVALPTPPAEEKQELSEAERERRRKKRARYRANKKKREEVSEENEAPQEPSSAEKPEPKQFTPAKEPAKSAPVKKQELPHVAAPETTPSKKEEETDEPIAIIRADNISQDKKDQKKS